jgi:hypothetical protein
MTNKFWDFARPPRPLIEKEKLPLIVSLSKPWTPEGYVTFSESMNSLSEMQGVDTIAIVYDSIRKAGYTEGYNQAVKDLRTNDPNRN